MRYKVNCLVPPEHYPAEYAYLERGRSTFTVTREFDNIEDAFKFLSNLRKSEQLEILKGLNIFKVEEKPLNDFSALDSDEFSTSQVPYHRRRRY